MSEEQKAIEQVKQEPLKTEKQISIYYGERSEIRELVDRMRAGLPNASEVPDSGIRALATAAYAHDLDPWNGEIWVIYNKNTGETSLMTGVKGLRKAAKKQLEERQNYYLDFTPIMPEEYADYGLDTPDHKNRPVALAEICHLRRGDACAQYSKTLRQIFDMCGSFETAMEMLGPMPVYVGIGVVRQGEKSKMEFCQLVKKRAEADALKRAFDLPFSDRVNGNGATVTVGNTDDDAIEGDFEVMHEEPRGNSANHETGNSEMPERPMQPDALLAYVVSSGEALTSDNGATDKQRKVLSGLLKGLYKGSATQEKDAKAYLEFVAGTDTTEKLSKKTASVLIDLVNKEGDDEWGTSDVAQEEAQRVLRVLYKEQGQLDMFDDSDGSGDDPPPDEAKNNNENYDTKKSILDEAFPRDEDGNPIDEEPEEKPEPKKAAAKSQKVKAENKIPVNAKEKKEPAKAEKKADEKPAEYVKDNGEDPQLLALKRSKPQHWLMAAEWLHKNFKSFNMTPGKLREEVAKNMGIKDPESLNIGDAWGMAIKVAQEAA